jgi:hypothetical protein
MYWRPLHEADLSTCLEMQPACLGDGLVTRAKALKVWRSLLDHPALQAMVIESEVPIAGHRIVGCGLGVFVSSQFADREIAHPSPGLNSRIIGSIVAGEPILLSYFGLGLANAGNGVDFVNMYGTWRAEILDTQKLAEVHALLGSSFVEHFAGYRFNRILKETIGASAIGLARSSRVYRLIAEFPESDSALGVVSRESALAVPYSVATALYLTQAPVLRLRAGQQKLLWSALDGRTDRELGKSLGLTIEATKKRWVSIFANVERFKPEIFDFSDAPGDSRGPQKRHHVIAYVRAHPEELQPYHWGSSGRARAQRASPKE